MAFRGSGRGYGCGVSRVSEVKRVARVWGLEFVGLFGLEGLGRFACGWFISLGVGGLEDFGV